MSTGKRAYQKFTDAQLQDLEVEFQVNAYPDRRRKDQMARHFQRTFNSVSVWFENRRRKEKRAQNGGASTPFHNDELYTPHSRRHMAPSPVEVVQSFHPYLNHASLSPSSAGSLDLQTPAPPSASRHATRGRQHRSQLRFDDESYEEEEEEDEEMHVEEEEEEEDDMGLVVAENAFEDDDEEYTLPSSATHRRQAKKQLQQQQQQQQQPQQTLAAMPVLPVVVASSKSKKSRSPSASIYQPITVMINQMPHLSAASMASPSTPMLVASTPVLSDDYQEDAVMALLMMSRGVSPAQEIARSSVASPSLPAATTTTTTTTASLLHHYPTPVQAKPSFATPMSPGSFLRLGLPPSAVSMISASPFGVMAPPPPPPPFVPVSAFANWQSTVIPTH